MVSFIVSLVVLVLGYFIYGKFVEKVFGTDASRKTPAVEKEDGVDFVSIPWYKAFMIQLLNIAGLGPIIGGIMGVLYGTSSFIWIVFGSIFAGAVHDYFSGMMSLRHNGQSISEVTGNYLGKFMRQFMRVFSVILLVFVGVVFILGPSNLLANMNMGSIFNLSWVWLIIILAYYFLATIVPVDKIIGKIYPIFGGALLFMAIGIGIMLIVNSGTNPIPEIQLSNLHPNGLPIWPLMFITIACGAISGFHSTQSPIMSRCINNEKYGRPVFYGAMIAEGVIALVWAAAAATFFGGVNGLSETIANGGWAVVVNKVSIGLLGPIGGVLAVLGVIACPITSGDTAFRSARLTIADSFKFDQNPIKNRLLLAIPLFIIAIIITRLPWQVIWRYFAFSNQTLAAIVLWTTSMYLARNKKLHWIATIPATFMTAVCSTYILMAPEGFQMSTSIAYPLGIIAAVATFCTFVFFIMPRAKKMEILQD